MQATYTDVFESALKLSLFHKDLPNIPRLVVGLQLEQGRIGINPVCLRNWISSQSQNLFSLFLDACKCLNEVQGGSLTSGTISSQFCRLSKLPTATNRSLNRLKKWNSVTPIETGISGSPGVLGCGLVAKGPERPLDSEWLCGREPRVARRGEGGVVVGYGKSCAESISASFVVELGEP